MRNFAVGFVIGAGVGTGGCYIYFKRQQGLQEISGVSTIWPAADPARSTVASEFGAPLTECIRVFDGYSAAYDYRTRNPKWVLEHITKESLEGEANRRQSEFFEDPGVDDSFRSHLDDYRNSGYDRGHMAPAADHKNSQKAMDETFSLSNISPQVGKGFNRDYWARFEKFVRDLTKSVDDVYVITGPVWMPRPDAEGKWTMQHLLIGRPPGLVSVPTHHYKVVVADGRKKAGKDKVVGVGAFLMPNAPIDAAVPLSAFAVPLESLEQLAGIRFFPAYMNQARRNAVDDAAQVWRHYGMQQLKPFDRISMGNDMRALPSPGSSGDTLALTAAGSQSAPIYAPGPAVSDPGFMSEVLQLPKTKGAGGAVHLCELNACKMPAEDFWLSRGGDDNGKGGGKGRGGSGGGNRLGSRSKGGGQGGRG